MNIERATELTRQAQRLADTIVCGLYEYDYDEAGNEIEDSIHARPGVQESHVRFIANAAGWLSGAVAGPDAALANDITKGLMVFSVSLTEGLAVARAELEEIVGNGISMPANVPQELCEQVGHCLGLVEEALYELGLTLDDPILRKLAR